VGDLWRGAACPLVLFTTNLAECATGLPHFGWRRNRATIDLTVARPRRPADRPRRRRSTPSACRRPPARRRRFSAPRLAASPGLGMRRSKSQSTSPRRFSGQIPSTIAISSFPHLLATICPPRFFGRLQRRAGYEMVQGRISEDLRKVYRFLTTRPHTCGYYATWT
jgi:hypothetical protein